MAFSQLFSSFAISVAANIVTSLFARNSTEKDIRAAFQDAIENGALMKILDDSGSQQSTSL